MIRIRAALAATAVVLAAAPAALAAPPPPTLTGEHFSPTFIESVGNCDTLPNPVIHYHVTGVATGPYSGTFNETGMIVITPLGTTTTAALVDLTAHFTIVSPTGQVDGVKTFTASSSGIGQCQVFSPAFIRIKTAKASNLSYLATIKNGPGEGHTYRDCGSSELFFSDVTLAPAFQAFGEDFVSRLAEPERAHPGRGGRSACL